MQLLMSNCPIQVHTKYIGTATNSVVSNGPHSLVKSQMVTGVHPPNDVKVMFFFFIATTAEETKPSGSVFLLVFVVALHCNATLPLPVFKFSIFGQLFQRQAVTAHSLTLQTFHC